MGFGDERVCCADNSTECQAQQLINKRKGQAVDLGCIAIGYNWNGTTETYILVVYYKYENKAQYNSLSRLTKTQLDYTKGVCYLLQIFVMPLPLKTYKIQSSLVTVSSYGII